MRTALKMVLTLSACLFLSAVVLARPSSRVTLEVAPEKDATGEWRLAFVFSNNSEETVSIYPSELPWGNPFAIYLHAAQLDRDCYDAPQLKPLHYIADAPADAPMMVVPGQKLTGHLALRQRYENIKEASTDCRIILFWTYELKDVERRSLGRVSGVTYLE